MMGKYILVQSSEGQLIAIPASSLRSGEVVGGGAVPVRASSAPPPGHAPPPPPARPASVDTSPSKMVAEVAEEQEEVAIPIQPPSQPNPVPSPTIKIVPKKIIATTTLATTTTTNVRLKPKPNKGNKMMLKSYGVPLLPKPPSMAQTGPGLPRAGQSGQRLRTPQSSPEVQHGQQRTAQNGPGRPRTA